MPARTRSQDAKRKLSLDDEVVDDPKPTKKPNTAVAASTRSKKGNTPSKDFFSPRKGKASSATTTSTTSFVTPQKKTGPTNLVTPGLDAEVDVTDDVERKEDDKKAATSKPKQIKRDSYVPTHLYKNVDYSTSEIDKLSDGEKKAYHFIIENFEIPSDLEQSRRYGPHSGSCFEERVLAAYQMNQLTRKLLTNNEDDQTTTTALPLLVCISCGNQGHMKRTCPELL